MSILKSNPALLIIDMQNGFCHPSGSFAQLGLPVSRHVDVIPRISRVRSLCRSHSIPVFYTQVAFEPDYSDAGLGLEGMEGLRDLKAFVRDTWDSAIVDELAPAQDEVVVQKTQNNAFWGSGLAERLRERRVDQVIATGVGINVCVESTVREAKSNGFHAVTVADAAATLTEEEEKASILNLRYFGGTISIEEFEKEVLARKK